METKQKMFNQLNMSDILKDVSNIQQILKACNIRSNKSDSSGCWAFCDEELRFGIVMEEAVKSKTV